MNPFFDRVCVYMYNGSNKEFYLIFNVERLAK